MTSPDREYDPDDNFANHADHGADVDDDEATLESLVWQLMLLINPGDDDAALQQFGAWQEAVVEAGMADRDDIDDIDPLGLLVRVIDWKSGFHVEATDPAALIQSVDELAARWNLAIDWGVDDPSDDEFLADADVGSLIALAHAKLREHGYTLWTWNVRGGASEDAYSGWIALRRDEEAMQALAVALGIELRLGSAH